MAKQLSKAEVTEVRRLYNEEGYNVHALSTKYQILAGDMIAIVHNFTEKEVYKLYYEGLTPKFIALKLGVGENVILDWFMCINNRNGYDKERFTHPSYHWRQQRDDLKAKDKKVCNTKEEQEAKLIRTLGNDIENAINKEKILNPEILEKIAHKLGYKNIRYFKKAIQVYGLMTDELEGIFNKMSLEPVRDRTAVVKRNKETMKHWTTKEIK